MWNPFKKSSRDDISSPKPAEVPRPILHSKSALHQPKYFATELEPQYQAWSEALEAAGVRANKPCTPLQIEAFEQELGAELTPELRQLYLMHDGMVASDDGKYRLLSLQEVRKVASYAHNGTQWFPPLAVDDWKLRTFFSTDNINAAIYLKGPLRGCVAEWGGGFAIDLPTYRNVDQFLFRATNSVMQDKEVAQYEPPWSDYPAGPSPNARAMQFDRHLVSELRGLLAEMPTEANEEGNSDVPSNREYVESCLIYVTPMEDVEQLRGFLDSNDPYILENLTISLKNRNLDAWITDDYEMLSWMKRLSELSVANVGNASSHAIEVLGSFRATDVRRYIRYVLDYCSPNCAAHWLERSFQRHAHIRRVEGRSEYQIVASQDWHPVGAKHGEVGKP